MIADAGRHRLVVTVEDGIRAGGAGSFIADAVADLQESRSVPRCSAWARRPRTSPTAARPDPGPARIGRPGIAAAMAKANPPLAPGSGGRRAPGRNQVGRSVPPGHGHRQPGPAGADVPRVGTWPPCSPTWAGCTAGPWAYWRATESRSAGKRPDPPSERAELPECVAALHSQLIEALSARPPDAPAWVFSSSAPHEAGWWYRRQALATGRLPPGRRRVGGGQDHSRGPRPGCRRHRRVPDAVPAGHPPALERRKPAGNLARALHRYAGRNGGWISTPRA